MEGYLYKKSQSGIGGLRPWQKRYFILKPQERKIVYFKNAVEDVMSDLVQGEILLDLIQDIRLFLDKKNGCRFDVITRDGQTVEKGVKLGGSKVNSSVLPNGSSTREGNPKTWSFRALHPESAIQWTQVIAQAADPDNPEEFLATLNLAPEKKTAAKVSAENPAPSEVKFNISNSKLKRTSLLSFQSTLTSHSGFTPFHAHLVNILLSAYHRREVMKANAMRSSTQSSSLEDIDADEDVDEKNIDLFQIDVDALEEEDGIELEADDENGLDDEPAVPEPDYADATMKPGDLSEAAIPQLVALIGSPVWTMLFLWEGILKKITEQDKRIKVPDGPRPPKRSSKKQTIFCPVEDCNEPRSVDDLYCQKHLPEFHTRVSSKLTLLDIDFLWELFYLTTLDDRLKLCALPYVTRDHLAQSTALHLLWISLMDERIYSRSSGRFSVSSLLGVHDYSPSRILTHKRMPHEYTRMQTLSQFVSKYVQGSHLVPIIRDALLSIACPRSFVFSHGLLEIWEPTSGLNYNYEAWKGVFLSMKMASSQIRVEIFEEINMLLIEDGAFKSWLLERPNWQSWILEAISDLSTEAEIDDETADKELQALRLALNSFTLVHYYVFMNESLDRGEFPKILISTLKEVRRAELSIQSRHIARLIFSSITTKLINSRKYFPDSLDSIIWGNLLYLTNLIRKFVFYSPQWDGAVSIVLGDECTEDNTSAVDTITRSSRSSFARTSISSSSFKKSAQGDFLPLTAIFAAQDEIKFIDMNEEKAYVHCDIHGVPVDKDLIFKTIKLLRTLHISESDLQPPVGSPLSPKLSTAPPNSPTLLYGPILDRKEIIERAKKELEFFVDASQFMEAMKWLNRNMSNVEMDKYVERFCKAKSSKERKKVLDIMGRQ